MKNMRYVVSAGIGLTFSAIFMPLIGLNPNIGTTIVGFVGWVFIVVGHFSQLFIKD